MEPGTGLRSYSVGDVIDGAEAEMKDLVTAGYVKALAVAKAPVIEKEPVKTVEVKKEKEAGK